jgi:AcrR family transcriptional regulator
MSDQSVNYKKRNKTMVRKPNPEKRERYLQSALKLFVANGVQNTSTAAIAKQAGTAAGTLFLYFPTKQNLVNELVMEVARAQSENTNAALSPFLSTRDSFFAIWESTIRWFLANMDAYQYIQQVRDSGMISEEVIQESNKYFEYYFTAIQKGLSESAIKPYPIDLIGEMLYRAIVAIMNLAIATSDVARQEEFIHSGFEIFWNGIKKDQG